ncbi:MAG TPA: T9SS type A sorting domain-containing protein [Saprospiraceae bacterium]|nr:T9SS type A sorting domain-containing protein [Saprospiraceae bacterium]
MRLIASFFSAIFTLICCASSFHLYAQTGAFDQSFGDNGMVTPDIDGLTARSHSIAVQPDSRILLGGSTWNPHLLILLRLLPDGSPDNSFGIDGKVKTLLELGNSFIFSAKTLVQPDGKIIQVGDLDGATGNSKFFLVRYNSNGSLDNTFGNAGKKIITGSTGSLANIRYAQLQPDGKIVLSGSLYSAATGQDIVVFRVLPNGDMDDTFGDNGKVLTNLGTANEAGWVLALQPDGKILVAGYKGALTSQNSMFLLRYLSDGSLDSTFGSGGINTLSFSETQDQPNAMHVMPDSSILLTGAFQIPQGNYDFVLIRCKADGALDTSFGDGGILRYDMSPGYDISSRIVLQSDGKIVLVGWSGGFIGIGPPRLTLLRLNADFTPDSTFGVNGVLKAGVDNGLENEGIPYDAALQPDGKIVIVDDEAENSSGQYVFCALRVLTGPYVGVLDFSSPANEVLLYPNPVESEATIEYTLEREEQLSITLHDMNGKLLRDFMTGQKREAGEHREILSMPASLAPGVYVLNIGNGKRSIAVKLIKR